MVARGSITGIIDLAVVGIVTPFCQIVSDGSLSLVSEFVALHHYLAMMVSDTVVLRLWKQLASEGCRCLLKGSSTAASQFH